VLVEIGSCGVDESQTTDLFRQKFFGKGGFTHAVGIGDDNYFFSGWPVSVDVIHIPFVIYYSHSQS
jgi:hypothetical protein